MFIAIVSVVMVVSIVVGLLALIVLLTEVLGDLDPVGGFWFALGPLLGAAFMFFLCVGILDAAG